MAEQSDHVPNQRGTSSGEIGENPVEVVSKRPPSKGNASDKDDVPDPSSTEPPEGR
ncbi:MAG TPA: hypothetical protein VIM62_12750 [Acidobacteriaceae bacterium]